MVIIRFLETKQENFVKMILLYLFLTFLVCYRLKNNEPNLKV
jgi:hypothetical protein